MARKTKARLKAMLEKAVPEQALLEEQLKSDKKIAALQQELAATKGKYQAAMAALDDANARADLHSHLIDMGPRPVKSKAHKKSAPATAILVLSDWHIEETVDPSTVNGLNEYSLPIARKRVQETFARAARLLAHERGLVDIDHLVVAVLGDLISGHIHEELMETCSLSPMAATREAGELLLGGLDEMRKLFSSITVVTSHGNHGRSTPKIRVATGSDHSFEYNLYRWLEKSTRNTPGLRWQIADGYLNYLEVQGYTVRFHHGDAVKYGGGVGGLTIPMNKKKATWDRSRHSDLDICGHFHTWLYHPYKFIVNGCLIGMSPYAVRISAEYQPPSQTLAIVDSRHGVTKALQLFADKDVRRESS